MLPPRSACPPGEGGVRGRAQQACPLRVYRALEILFRVVRGAIESRKSPVVPVCHYACRCVQPLCQRSGSRESWTHALARLQESDSKTERARL